MGKEKYTTWNFVIYTVPTSVCNTCNNCGVHVASSDMGKMFINDEWIWKEDVVSCISPGETEETHENTQPVTRLRRVSKKSSPLHFQLPALNNTNNLRCDGHVNLGDRGATAFLGSKTVVRRNRSSENVQLAVW